MFLRPGVWLPVMFEYQQARMSCDDDLHVLRKPQSAAALPAAALDELLNLLEEPFALCRC